MATFQTKNLSTSSIINHIKGIISKNSVENKVNNHRLIEEWQDWIFSNVISVNYLNTLMVLTSRQDFAFHIPVGYTVKYVQNTKSFVRTISQLDLQMRNDLSSAREDLNRVHTGMDRVPGHLKMMLVLLKQAPIDLLQMLFPDSFVNIEKLVNDSLVVLERPKVNFQHVLHLLTEIHDLLNVTTVDERISLQVYDIKTHWIRLTELVVELAKQADTARQSFLQQFNWILETFIRPDLAFNDSHRDTIILLLLLKIIEIDQTSDLLGMITKAYSDISSKYTDEQIGGNAHLLLLPTEEIRRRYLKQFQRDLVPQVVDIARLALERHTAFIQRDKNRRKHYEKFLSETTTDDLIGLLG